MSSPDLLQTQLDRWTNAYRNKAVSSIGDPKAIEKEIAKLKDQEGRYNKGYGAGVFTIEQLKEYRTYALPLNSPFSKGSTRRGRDLAS
jgi:site-specific DNA recombinase